MERITIDYLEMPYRAFERLFPFQVMSVVPPHIRELFRRDVNCYVHLVLEEDSRLMIEIFSKH